jgi:hypothetical protein
LLGVTPSIDETWGRLSSGPGVAGLLEACAGRWLRLFIEAVCPRQG